MMENTQRDQITKISAEPFDITLFSVTIPTPLPATQTYNLDGLRFYSNAPIVVGPTSVSFGSSTSPTWTVIGLATSPFMPMLLVYGVATLNYGSGLSNAFSWTDGIYTLANTASTDESDSTVSGGMLIQPSGGSLYTDALLNNGVCYAISGISGGVVTTMAAFDGGLTTGQPIQFAALVNPSVVQDGAEYYVDQIRSTTTDRKSTRLNSSHYSRSRMPSSA